MQETEKIDAFLAAYDKAVRKQVYELREVLLQYLPDVMEQLDSPARMIAYCYGQQYKELVCMIIPSKKGVKLGFNAGVSLPDPEGWLEGTGKISRYVVIKSEEMLHSETLKELLRVAYAAYLERMN